ncbi:2-amino-4-hydroxy-6-hydroxymethyldihydropteridine diphosphokinase [Lacihabitans sp. CCS-44]|uniref:2-amino-4-hydroxy-6- hydroxymethyldihydropteridine diphosphokinase n=1 Tax=Lacihabitans sp. CCS-44 TaxID=2487331 RepID=UPI0020CF30C3|nr:2-amino-4-hydroxy-6-hydroxymethyldihydropteridine diphosphokinase [Lacihabitans sp. CCS-44]MCP9756886.1 2-amino-4-hydroxy-6-hydroxymethyldihydropteridine diphosphokinase [Lacihabitans sp. CCS-44]
MFKAYIGLGSNLGQKEENLKLAISKVENEIGQISKKSSLFETEAWGVENQGNYYNMAIEIHTKLLPLELIEKVLELEKELGRVREKKWDSRIIDIDILLYENLIISTDHLHIPHLFLEKRNFVLEPLNEIIPNFIHPKLRKSIAQLSAESIDKSWIKKL